jgi:hypothetical protein
MLHGGWLQSALSSSSQPLKQQQYAFKGIIRHLSCRIGNDWAFTMVGCREKWSSLMISGRGYGFKKVARPFCATDNACSSFQLKIS